jgi:hypothetical protein
VTIDRVKVYGPLLVLNFLAEELGLSKLLSKRQETILRTISPQLLKV